MEGGLSPSGCRDKGHRLHLCARYVGPQYGPRAWTSFRKTTRQRTRASRRRRQRPQWLAEHAADYGFILRYPSDKTEATGMDYEPWHYRYVGSEQAHKIKESGLCLEEYLAQ